MGGASTISFSRPASAGTQTGYATVTVQAGRVPSGTAVFRLEQEGVVVSEAGVPAVSATRSARLFMDYGLKVNSVPPAPGAATVDVYTGLAVANPGTASASMVLTLRDMQGRILTSGRGTLASGAHFARFLHQLQEVAPDFRLPSDFPTALRFGTLDVASSQPLSVLGLRMTVNQRANLLFTSLPVADLETAPGKAPLYFPQLADGDGYTTTFILINGTETEENGWVRFYDDEGVPLSLAIAGGASASAFRYSVPPNGIFRLQTDGSRTAAQVGSAQLLPDAGTATPAAAGLFSRSIRGILQTESGIAATTPIQRARMYIDLSGSHDSGLALAQTKGGSQAVTLRAYLADGKTEAGSGPATVTLAGNGHKAAFVRQLVQGLPSGFRGVLDISSSSPFAALTLRSLQNSRGDFLLTAFPLADQERVTTAMPVFPQIAAGGGYLTEFLLLSQGAESTSVLSLFDDKGVPLPF